MIEPIHIPRDIDPVIAERLRKKGSVRWQHFVPVFYLNYFVGSGGLTVLKRNERRILRRPKSPKGCACAEFFYANWEGKNDLLAQIAEVIFEDLEGQFGRLIPPILDRIRGTGPLTLADKHTLADFMCLLWMRNPQFLEWVKGWYAEVAQTTLKLTVHMKGDAIFEEHPDIFRDMTPEKRANAIDFMNSDTPLEASNRLPFQIFIDNYPTWRRWFGRLKWKVYVNRTRKSFVTSDNPTSVIDVSGDQDFGGTFLQRRHLLALAPDLMVEALGPAASSKPIQRHTILKDDDPLIVSLNSHICFCATNWVYAATREPFEDILRELASREAIVGPIDASSGGGPVHATRPLRRAEDCRALPQRSPRSPRA